MRINEKGVNMQITDDIKDYLYKKLTHLEKFINNMEKKWLSPIIIK